MKAFLVHRHTRLTTSNGPSLKVIGRIPSIAPYPIGDRDSSQCQELGSEGQPLLWVRKWAIPLLLRYFSRLERDSYLMLLSDWMLDSLAELMILDAEPELMAHFTTFREKSSSRRRRRLSDGTCFPNCNGIFFFIFIIVTTVSYTHLTLPTTPYV